MHLPKVAEAVAYALRRLRDELPANLIYHSLWHTESDVLPSALQLARLSGLTPEQTDLLQVAAAFHDIGYVESPAEHERNGASIAAAALPGFGFEAPAIQAIVSMIMATRLPQSPGNLSEQLLADADLDVLGRADYFERNDHLRQETASLGGDTAQPAWMVGQLKFLEDHRYFTPAARDRRDAGKQAHIATLRSRLGR